MPSDSSHRRRRQSHPGHTSPAVATLLAIAALASGCGGRTHGFDGELAYGWVERQVAFGPRVPGTTVHEECADALAAALEPLADEVRVQRFVQDGVPMRNIVASFRPEVTERIFLVAHWDTRPRADEDPDPARRSLPVPGANDGASGVAVLLEVARCLAADPPPRGVDLFLVDGEDGGESGVPDSWCLGSEHLAASLRGYRPRMGIVVDMVGDADLRLPKERYSLEHAPRQTDWLWSLARSVGSPAFVDEIGTPVLDDHVPFLRRGIPTVDVIDFDYPHWHTTADEPDKVSAASLAQVGRVLLAAAHAETLP